MPGSLDNIPLIQGFRLEEKLMALIKNIDSPIFRGDFSLYISMLYKELSLTEADPHQKELYHQSAEIFNNQSLKYYEESKLD